MLDHIVDGWTYIIGVHDYVYAVARAARAGQQAPNADVRTQTNPLSVICKRQCERERLESDLSAALNAMKVTVSSPQNCSVCLNYFLSQVVCLLWEGAVTVVQPSFINLNEGSKEE